MYYFNYNLNLNTSSKRIEIIIIENTISFIKKSYSHLKLIKFGYNVFTFYKFCIFMSIY